MKLNKKSLLCTFMLVSAMLFALPACSSGNQVETAHTHTFSDQWTYDAISHWHEPTCDDISFKSNLEKHTFSNGVCSVCGYQDPNYVPSTGGGNTPEDQNPNEDEGSEGEELTPEEEALFGGDYTEISDADQISQIKEYLSGVVALLKEGKGYGLGEISYHEKRDYLETFSVVSGASGDLSSVTARYKQYISSDDVASESPICYAEGNYAYEEYSDKSYVYNIENVGKKLIQNLSNNIYQIVSDVPERSEGDCSFSYKQDGAITVVQLFYVIESHDVEGKTGSLESTQKNTVRFAFYEDKVLGLYKNTDTEYKNPVDPGYHSIEEGTCSVIVGNNPFTIPKRENCTEQEDYIPSWTK